VSEEKLINLYLCTTLFLGSATATLQGIFWAATAVSWSCEVPLSCPEQQLVFLKALEQSGAPRDRFRSDWDMVIWVPMSS